MEGSGKYIYNESDAEYVVKIKGHKPWWIILLLLLLPLILLIPFEKDIVFKTVNKTSNKEIQNVDVKFQYVKHTFIKFNPIGFLSKDTIIYENKSDEKGEVLFTNVKYTLFQTLLYGKDATEATATAGCLIGDTITPTFNSLSAIFPEKIELAYKGYDLNFKIIDADDNEPIPDANVKAIIKGDETNTFNQNSDPGGYAQFNNTPLCSNITVIAEKEGYTTDTLSGDVETIIKGEAGRTLRLKPGKGIVSFTVKDLINRQTIPGAKATLISKNNTITLTTNTNGVGKGFFDSINVNKTIKINVEKLYYNDTTTEEFTVLKYNKLSDDDKTIYMRPKTESLIFRNVDAVSNKPIVGVANVIYINGRKISTEYSNNQGCFNIFEIKPDDKISIEASKGGYVKNDQSIKNKKSSELDNQAKRDIPLYAIQAMHSKPRKNCGVHFSGTLLSDVEIKGHISKIYQPDKYGEYVGDGIYPSNQAAFPNAVQYTFDAIAVDKGTHLIIYSEPNFKGKILLDVTGPKLINNVKWKTEERIKDVCTKTFSPEFESSFPKSCRIWSSENMNKWDYGSVKITCDN